MKKNEEVVLSITLGFTKYKSQFYGWIKNIKNAGNNGFIFNQIVKLTIIFDSNISNINICHYLKFPIPIMHRNFSRILSPKSKHEKLSAMI